MSVSLDVPPTQNTAPVLEFMCLYTRDLRRKEKRWRDGRLKYHTFNKRVMAYDEKSNFLGDTHWREDSAFGEGEELELERGGILVEVANCVGKKDQDLTELVDKRLKEKEERAAAKTAAGSSAGGLGQNQGSLTPAPHLRQKPLSTLLNPSGHYGRAVFSTTSPFEERQRTINGNGGGGGDENDRPSKRRKPNESIQSKNGYAQNLMGTSLTLTSSKPPSTPVIRHEPLKLKSTITSVDLTLDDEDRVAKKSIRFTPNVDAAEKARKEKGTKFKQHRSPPRKVGYASNLTGVALSLSTLQTTTTKRVSTPVAKPTPRVKDSNTGHKIAVPIPTPRMDTQEGNDSSSETLDDSFVDIDSVTPSVEAGSKPKSTVKRSKASTPKEAPRKLLSSSPVNSPAPKSTVKKPKISKLKETPCKLASPSPGNSPAPKSKPAKSLPGTAARTLETSTPDQPVSTLKIKARAPRGMMMLKGRPSSRPSSGPSGKPSGPKAIPKPSDIMDGPVLSQDTMQLESYGRKLKERQQARESGKRYFANPDLEDFSSPPENKPLENDVVDNGISHQKIDLLLTRKTIAAAPIVKPPAIRKTVQTARQNSGDSQMRSSPTEKEQASSVIVHSIYEDNHEPRPDVLRENSAPDAKRPSVLNPNVKAPIIPTPKRPTKSYEPNTNTDGAENQRTVTGPRGSSPTVGPRIQHLNQIITTTSKISETVPAPGPNKVESPAPAPVVECRPRPPNASEDVFGALQSAAKHFRAIVKTSASSSTNSPQQPMDYSKDQLGIPSKNSASAVGIPPQPVKDLTDLLEKPPSPNSNVQKSEPASSEILSNEIPEHPVEQEPPQVSNQVGFRSANGINKSNEPKPWEQSALTNKTRMGQPVFKLTNPATRGKTIHAATNDVGFHSFTRTGPPAAQVSRRPAAAQASGRNDVPREGYRTDPADAPSTGPWSRESFDLFGSWKPPRRGAAHVSG